MNLIGLLSLLVFFKILFTLLQCINCIGNMENTIFPIFPMQLIQGEIYLRLLLAHLPNNIYSTDLKKSYYIYQYNYCFLVYSMVHFNICKCIQ